MSRAASVCRDDFQSGITCGEPARLMADATNRGRQERAWFCTLIGIMTRVLADILFANDDGLHLILPKSVFLFTLVFFSFLNRLLGTSINEYWQRKIVIHSCSYIKIFLPLRTLPNTPSPPSKWLEDAFTRPTRTCWATHVVLSTPVSVNTLHQQPCHSFHNPCHCFDGVVWE